MNAWESVFSQSKANRGFYDEERLPQSRWEWPHNTWFQARLDYVRENDFSRYVRTQKEIVCRRGNRRKLALNNDSRRAQDGRKITKPFSPTLRLIVYVR